MNGTENNLKKIHPPKGYETFHFYFLNEIHYYQMGYALMASQQPNAAQVSFAQARNYEGLQIGNRIN